ncbi:hypothetical protein L6452_40766 [Arctium lappa]|uniref:Uncharacterized protein n=1 Tax=Arctium lappa TaxID=4217 RepID=A0ACB8XNY3_ARCLA|nr:hypothetical protein L6452_40766 [Arctium lappa]
MAARTRGPSKQPPSPVESHPKSLESTATSTEPRITPAKPSKILLFSLSLFYLIFYHYRIETKLKQSILIDASPSFDGFFVTLMMILVASRYVIRRNLFGYDINKKGTPQGHQSVSCFFYVVHFLV